MQPHTVTLLKRWTGEGKILSFFLSPAAHFEEPSSRYLPLFKIIWIKLCSDLLTKWLSGALNTRNKENEICWCCSDFVTHLEASEWQTLPNLLNPLCHSLSAEKLCRLPTAAGMLPCASAWRRLKCNEGCRLQLMGLISRPTASNYNVILHTFQRHYFEVVLLL